MRSIDDRRCIVTLQRIPRGALKGDSAVCPREAGTQQERMIHATRAGCLLYSALGVAVVSAVAGSESYHAPCAIVIVLIVGGAIFARRVWRVDAMHHLPRLGLCAACTYRIEGLAPAEDGCVVCPECGAAWRMPERSNQSSNSSS